MRRVMVTRGRGEAETDLARLGAEEALFPEEAEAVLCLGLPDGPPPPGLPAVAVLSGAVTLAEWERAAAQGWVLADTAGVREFLAKTPRPAGLRLSAGAGREAPTASRAGAPLEGAFRGRLESAEVGRDLPFPARGTARVVPQGSGARRRGLVVASFSTVGGAGKTFLASNLASFLALKGFGAVLVDFDLPHGDAVRAAGVWRGELQNPEAYRAFLKGHPTVCGWRAHARSLGAAMLRHRLGFAVVPRDADAPEEIPKADAEDLLAVLRGGFDAVVVDMGVSPGRAQAAAALEAADLVLIVAGQDDKTIAKLAHWREELKKAGSGPERAALVVNRVNELGFYRPRDVAAKLGFPAFYEVPEDPQAARAMDRAGKAAVELADSAAGRALAALFGASVLSLLGPPESAGSEKPARGGLFGFGRLFARGGSRG